jgi:hypothetical protein
MDSVHVGVSLFFLFEFFEQTLHQVVLVILNAYFYSEEDFKICRNEGYALQTEPNATYKKFEGIPHISLLAHPNCRAILNVCRICTPLLQ